MPTLLPCCAEATIHLQSQLLLETGVECICRIWLQIHHWHLKQRHQLSSTLSFCFNFELRHFRAESLEFYESNVAEHLRKPNSLCPTVKLPGLSCQGIADTTRSHQISRGNPWPSPASRQDKVAQMRLRIKSIKELRQSEDSQPEAGKSLRQAVCFPFWLLHTHEKLNMPNANPIVPGHTGPVWFHKSLSRMTYESQ